MQRYLRSKFNENFVVCFDKHFDRRFDFFQSLSKDILATTGLNSINFFLFELYESIEFKEKKFIKFDLVVTKISLLKFLKKLNSVGGYEY